MYLKGKTLRFLLTQTNNYQIMPQHHSRMLNDLSSVPALPQPTVPKPMLIVCKLISRIHSGENPACSSTRHISHLSVRPAFPGSRTVCSYANLHLLIPHYSVFARCSEPPTPSRSSTCKTKVFTRVGAATAARYLRHCRDANETAVKFCSC